MAEVTDQKIRELAYQLWEQDGAPQGRDDQYWHAAKELLADEGEADPSDKPLTEIPVVPLAGLSNK